MRRYLYLWIAAALSLSSASVVMGANAEADYRAAMAAAQLAERQAGTLKNRWTTTELVLKAAETAAATGNFNAATTAAKQAEALAKASIAQAQEQKSAWRAAVIR